MRASEINADKELLGLLTGRVSVPKGEVTVYCYGERPTTENSNDFIEISYNGGVESITDALGVLRGYLMITLYSKLRSDGTVKSERVRKILAQFEDLVNRQQTEHYYYKYDLGNFVTPTTADLSIGYSITVFNVQWRTT